MTKVSEGVQMPAKEDKGQHGNAKVRKRGERSEKVGKGVQGSARKYKGQQ